MIDLYKCDCDSKPVVVSGFKSSYCLFFISILLSFNYNITLYYLSIYLWVLFYLYYIILYYRKNDHKIKPLFANLITITILKSCYWPQQYYIFQLYSNRETKNV